MNEQDIQEMKQDIKEIKTLLIGIPNTEARGLCGELHDTVKMVETNSNHIKKLYVGLAVLGATIGGGAYGFIQTLVGA